MAVRESETRWLGLQEACRLLRVHPDTLRQWADKGRIRTFRTPGGHRRFSQADVESMSERTSPELELLLEASVGRTRLSTAAGALSAEAWYGHFDEAAKQKQRELGHELMRMLVSHASNPGTVDAGAIGDLGARYAAVARETGLSLGDAIRAYRHFERMVRSTGTTVDESTSWFLNEVLIAMVESLQATPR